MRTKRIAIGHFILGVSLVIAVPCIFAQQTAPTATGTASIVPRLIAFSGAVKDGNGRPVRGVVGIAFSLYREQEGGAALWIETQNVEADATGHYTAMLGTTKPNGVPLELFTAGEARWLGIQPSGQAEQPRVLMVSAPYALKAADAETVGGLSPSAFVLAAPPVAVAPSDETASSPVLPPATITGSGTTGFLPLWTGSSTLANSAAFQSGTGTVAKIGIATTTPASTLDVNGAGTIRGLLSLPPTGTATSTAGKNSQSFNLTSSSFKSGTGGGALNQNFRWQAEPVANNSTNPSGTLNLLFGAGAAAPAETGLKIASNGRITFAAGQTIPAADVTLTGDAFGPASLTTVAGLQGFPVANVVPTVNQVLTFDGASWTPQVAQSTNFTGVLQGEVTGKQNVTVVSNAVATDTLNAIVRRDSTGSFAATSLALSGGLSLPNGNALSMGGFAFLSNTGTDNTYLGANAGAFEANGTDNSAVGFNSLMSISIGSNNSAFGSRALFANTSGASNSAFGSGALAANSTGSSNTAFGQQALSSNTFGVTNAAFGTVALAANVTGNNNSAFGTGALAANTVDGNSAFGDLALNKNTTGSGNSSFGTSSLSLNTTGGNNSAFGDLVLWTNTTGSNNSAFGNQAMGNSGGGSTTGSNNSAFGYLALSMNGAGSGNSAFGANALANSNGSSNSAFGNNSLAKVSFGAVSNSALGNNTLNNLVNGNSNIAIGDGGGANLTSSESGNIYIGNAGVASESTTIRIGTSQTAAFMAGVSGVSVSGTAVMVSSTGQLGVTLSSQRFKQSIVGMDGESAVLMKLRPVSFYYKPEFDAAQTRQYGLVAEEVAQVAPQLVVFDQEGKPQTVRYHFVNAMLLNEVQKQHRQLDQQQRTISQQQAQIHVMQENMEKEQTMVAKMSEESRDVRQLQEQNASLLRELARLSAEVKQIKSHLRKTPPQPAAAALRTSGN